MSTSLSRTLLRLMLTSVGGVLIAGSLQAQELAQTDNKSVVDRGATAEEIAATVFTLADMNWWRLDELPGVEITYLIGDSSGRNPYVFRLRFPDGYELKPHKHGKARFVTVLQGNYHIGFGKTADRSKTVAYPAGTFIMLPANMPHFGWTEGETILQMSGNGPFTVRWANGNR